MNFITLLIICAINGILAKNDRNVKTTSTKSFDNVLRDRRHGLRTQNEEIEAEKDIQQSLHKARRRCKRKKRSPTQAGYTHDVDTCQLYNENLQKVWSKVSKYFSTSDVPSNKALHNIALIVQAYLDHQHNKNRVTNATSKPDVDTVDDDPMAETISKIQKVLTTDHTNPVESIYAIISKELKPNSNVNKDCYNLNEEYLRTSIDLAYQNNLDDSSCTNNENKRSLKQNTRDTDDVIISNRPSKTNLGPVRHSNNSETSYNQKLSKVVVDYKNDMEKNAAVSSNSLSQATVKQNLRKLQECQLIARRKFIDTIRSVIKRFMLRSECQIDATFRSFNNNRLQYSRFNHFRKRLVSFDSKNNFLREYRDNIKGINYGKKNTTENYNNPMKNLYESRYNSIYMHKYEFHPWLSKFKDQILKDYKVVKPHRMHVESYSPKEENNNIASYLYHSKSNNHDNIINHIKPASGHFATTQNTIKFNTYKTQHEKKAKINYKICEHLQNRYLKVEDEQERKDKLELLKYSKKNDEITARYYDTDIQNKHITKISKRSIRRSLGKCTLDDNTEYELKYQTRHPNTDNNEPHLINKSKITVEEYGGNKIINVTNNEIPILKVVKHYPVNFIKVLSDNGKVESSLHNKNGPNTIISKSKVVITNYQSFVKENLVINNLNDNLYLGNSQHSHNIVNVGLKSKEFDDKENESLPDSELSESDSDNQTEEYPRRRLRRSKTKKDE